MALFGNIGPLLGAGLNILGATQGGGLGSLGRLGSAFVGGALSLVPAGGPVVAMAGGQQAVQFAGRTLMVGVGSAITRVVAPILIKIAEKLGRRTLSLRQAVRIVRRMGKVITDPAAIAFALGISTSELAELIFADSQRPRRRMNPANVTALRRSMRRLSSFHRLCVRVDALRGRGRGRGRRGAGGPPTVQVVRGG
jgi:hypothetical protein